MKKKGEYQIPFDRKGSLMSYPEERFEWRDREGQVVNSGFKQRDDLVRIQTEPIWKDNYTFTSTLQITGYYRGRSAGGIELRDLVGRRFTMFLKDFEEMIPKVMIYRGHVFGRWTFVKRGQNYGIRLEEVPD